MFRPIFSASYSAKLIDRQRSNDVREVEDRRRTDQWPWVQQGVTAHGEIWGTYAGAEYDVGTDGEGGHVEDDESQQTLCDSEDDDDDDTKLRTGTSRSHAHGRSIPSRPSSRRAAQLSHLPRTSTVMTIKPRWWISLWFLVTIPVIFWDAGYCFLRPRSMRGGDLHWLWKPYSLYQDIDYVYGLRAYENGEGFTNAQSFLNIVENFMNIAYLWLAHVSESPVAPLLGFASVVMTLSKTTLYWLQEYYCGACSVGHNDLTTLIVYWIIPNGLWLLVPSLIVVQLGKDILGSLKVVDRNDKKKASGKKH